MSGQLHQVSCECSSVGFVSASGALKTGLGFGQLAFCIYNCMLVLAIHINSWYVCMYLYIHVHVLHRDVIHVFCIIYHILYIDVSWWFLCLHIDKEEDFTACLRSALPTPAKRFQAHKVDPICRMKVDSNGIGYPGGLVNLVRMQSDITILLKVMMKTTWSWSILNLSAHLNVWWMCGRCSWSTLVFLVGSSVTLLLSSFNILYLWSRPNFNYIGL